MLFGAILIGALVMMLGCLIQTMRRCCCERSSQLASRAVNSISPSPLSIQATTKTFRLYSRHRGLFSTCVLLSYTDRTVVELAAFRVDDYVKRGIIPFITKQRGQPSADLVQYCHQNDGSVSYPRPQTYLWCQMFLSSMMRRAHSPHRPSMGRSLL
jgi:hypothetical protein